MDFLLAIFFGFVRFNFNDREVPGDQGCIRYFVPLFSLPRSSPFFFLFVCLNQLNVMAWLNRVFKVLVEIRGQGRRR